MRPTARSIRGLVRAACAAAVLVCLLAQVQRAWADVPATQPDRGGWGERVDGLACRLIVPSTRLCQGQAVTVVIEVRNFSDRPVTCVSPMGTYWLPDTRLVGEDPPDDDRLTISNYFPPKDLRAEAFIRLAPGETVRRELANLRDYNRRLLDGPGRYRLRFSYSSPPAAVRPDAWTGRLLSASADIEIAEPTAADLTVHEWGVFVIEGGSGYANAALRGDWEALPEFFYRQYPHPRMRENRGEVRVLKPVVYFYTARPGLGVEMSVAFARGAPVVWWPCASEPVLDLRPGAPAPVDPFRRLTWNAWVGPKVPVTFGGQFTSGQREAWRELAETPLPQGWPARLRLPDAAPVTVSGVPVQPDRFARLHLERSRFIYYDGLTEAFAGLDCRVGPEDKATVRNQADRPLSGIFVVDRRGCPSGRPARFGRLDRLEAGAHAEMALAEVADADWPKAPRGQVRRVLLDAGLKPAEADSLLDIWSDGFFESPGVTAFCLLPRAEYDRILPIRFDPQPGRLVRVGLLLYPRLDADPDLPRRVAGLIAKLDAAEFRAREQALLDLTALGPAVLPLVRAALARGGLGPEATTRLQTLIQRWDATEYLPAGSPGPTTQPDT